MLGTLRRLVGSCICWWPVRPRQRRRTGGETTGGAGLKKRIKRARARTMRGDASAKRRECEATRLRIDGDAKRRGCASLRRGCTRGHGLSAPPQTRAPNRSAKSKRQIEALNRSAKSKRQSEALKRSAKVKRQIEAPNRSAKVKRQIEASKRSAKSKRQSEAPKRSAKVKLQSEAPNRRAKVKRRCFRFEGARKLRPVCRHPCNATTPKRQKPVRCLTQYELRCSVG